jgi:hypothetical protein
MFFGQEDTYTGNCYVLYFVNCKMHISPSGGCVPVLYSEKFIRVRVVDC